MKKEIILIGAGGHAESIIDIIENKNEYSIAGLIGFSHEVGMTRYGYQVIGTDKDLVSLRKDYQHACLAVGHMGIGETRKNLFIYMKELAFYFPPILANNAYASSRSVIGEGSVIMCNAFLNAGARIGKISIINTGSIVEHGTSIGENTHISTGVIVNGNVQIGDNCFIGSGSVVREGISIASNSFIKMSQRLISDVKDI